MYVGRHKLLGVLVVTLALLTLPPFAQAKNWKKSHYKKAKRYYVVKKVNPGPSVAVPHDGVVPHLKDTDGETLARGIKPGGTLSATVDGLTLRFPLPRLAAAMVARMDGERTIGGIFEALREADGNLERDTFDKQFAQLYAALNGIGTLYLG